MLNSIEIIELEHIIYLDSVLTISGNYPEIVGTGTTEQESIDSWYKAYDMYYKKSEKE